MSGEGRPTASDTSLLFTPPLLPSFIPRLSKGSSDVSIIETKWGEQHGDRMAGPLLLPPSASNNARAFVFEFERLSYVTQQPSEYDHRRQSAAVFRLLAPSVTHRDVCAWREDGCLFDYHPHPPKKTKNKTKKQWIFKITNGKLGLMKWREGWTWSFRLPFLYYKKLSWIKTGNRDKIFVSAQQDAFVGSFNSHLVWMKPKDLWAADIWYLWIYVTEVSCINLRWKACDHSAMHGLEGGCLMNH